MFRDVLIGLDHSPAAAAALAEAVALADRHGGRLTILTAVPPVQGWAAGPVESLTAARGLTVELEQDACALQQRALELVPRCLPVTTILRRDPLVRLLAVRHGETTLNAERRLTGRLDPPLTARGREQAAALAPLLAGRRFDRFLHSGARRAADTLALACGAANLGEVPARADARWLERSFGTLEGGPSDAWTHPPGDLDAAPPGGESYRALAGRVLAALDDLRADAVREGRPLDVLLCAHSGVLRMLSAIAADAPDAAAALAFGARNGEAVALAYAAPATPRFLAPAPAS